jgi:hypothetical protein
MLDFLPNANLFAAFCLSKAVRLVVGSMLMWRCGRFVISTSVNEDFVKIGVNLNSWCFY